MPCIDPITCFIVRSVFYGTSQNLMDSLATVSHLVYWENKIYLNPVFNLLIPH